MNIFKRRHKQEAKLHEDRTQNETESVKIILDSHLAEFETTRREIEQYVNIAEHSLDYLFILIAAIFSALQLFVQPSVAVLGILQKQHFLYLVLASLTLWFPLSYLLNMMNIGTLGAYITTVLSPKINRISQSMKSKSKAIEDFIEWENSKFPPWLRGAVKWDFFRAKIQFRAYIYVFIIIVALRYIFLAGPSLIFLSVFLVTKSSTAAFWVGWSGIEKVMSIIYITLVIIFFIGAAFGTRFFIFISSEEKLQDYISKN